MESKDINTEQENEKIKSGFAVLIGRPNVGKSTLMNYLIGQKIAITSEKPQTTRNRIQTVYTDERGQIVFLDTPGIHKAKNKLGDYMVDVAQSTIDEADVILWLVEPSTFIGAGEQKIAEKLRQCSRKAVILVINKVDTVKKEDVVKFMDAYRSVCDFTDIVPVSALKKNNLDTLMDAIFKALPYGPLYYDEETVTEIPMREIAGEMIREKALRLLRDEVPHGIAVEINKCSERDDGIMDIEANIICEKESHKGMIIGKNGSMLKKIGTAARIDIEQMMEMKVNLQLWVKVRKEWRDNDLMLKSFGYKK